jgi:hypothetical protein
MPHPPPLLTNRPVPKPQVERPEDSSLLEPPCARPAHGHATGWFTRCRVEFPSTNPYNNHTTTTHHSFKTNTKPHQPTKPIKPHKTRYKTPQDPKRRAVPVPPLATLRYGAARAAGCLPEGPPQSTQDPKGGTPRAAPAPPLATPRHTALRRGGGGRRPTRRAAPTPRTPRAAPAPPLVTLRHGAARAPGGLPEGPPQPPGPQGRRRHHPSSPCATARRGRPEAYPKGRPYCQKSDSAPPEIGRGSKRALTHRAGKSNRLM